MFDTQKVIKEIEIKGFNNIYYFEFGKNFSHAPEKHSFWEMVYVDSGRVNAVTNGVGCTLEQGQVIFHEPGEVHAHLSDKHVSNNMLVISFSSESSAMKFFRSKTFTLDKACKTLLSLFLEEARLALGTVESHYENKDNLNFKTDSFGSSQLLECYFTEFLLKLIRKGNEIGFDVVSSKKSRDIADDSLSELICEYMKNNIYNPLTLKDVCLHFMSGKTRICEIFHESTGQSPMDYYADLKIKEAKKLIRERNHSISQISDMLCYSSVHTFSRAFKKMVGMSPTAYGRSIGN